MELRTFLKVLRRESKVLTLFVVAVLAAGAAWLATKPTMYLNSLSILANYEDLPAETEGGYFEYDNYYGIQVAQIFNETIGGLLKNDDVVHTVFARAEVPTDDLQTPGKFFRITPKGKHVTEIRFVSDDRAAGEKLSAALIGLLQERAAAFSMTEEGTIALNIEGPSVEEEAPEYLLYGVILLIAALGFGVLLVLAITYLKNRPQTGADMAQALGFPLLAELKHRALSDSSAPALLAVRDTLLAGADDLLVGITSTDAVWSDKLAGTLAAAIQPLKRAEVLRLTGLGTDKLAKETEHLHARHGQITLIGLPEALRPDLSPQLLARIRCLLILLPEAGVDRAALQTLRTRFKELSIPVYVVTLA